MSGKISEGPATTLEVCLILKALSASLVFVSFSALADTAPHYDQIFSLKASQEIYPCSQFSDENYYCEKPLVTFNSQGQPVGTKLAKKFSIDGGEGKWYIIAESRKSLNAKECLIQTAFEDGTQSYLKVPCQDLRGVDKALEETVSASEPSTYIFNPDLKTVDLSKDGKVSISVQEIFALKDNPNPRIGTLSVVLDPKESRDPKSKKVLSLSFPGKGQTHFTSSKLLELKSKTQYSLNEDQKAHALKEPFVIKMPVYRKQGNRYLVELPNFILGDLGMDPKGAIGDEVTISKFYSWIESGGVLLDYRADVKDKLLYFEEPLLPSASLKFKMERGSDFRKDSKKWTSVKIFAHYVDFEATQQKDENGNEGYLSRKKVFLREIFFPVFDSKGHINLWPGWESGC